MNQRITLNRRDLLRVAAGAGLVAGVASRRLAGAQPWHPASGLRLAGPVSGLPTLDPALSRELQSNYLLAQVFRGLVALDEHLDPVPELAETVDILAEGQRYRFTMRGNAAFHDGRPVLAADVAASLARALDPAIAGGDISALAARTYLGDIAGAPAVVAGTATTLAGVTVLDDHHLDIALQAPSPTFLARLASVTAAIVDTSQITADPDWMDHPNGTGPYQVREWQPGNQLELNAASTWWPGVAPIREVRVRLGASAVAPLNLYQANEVDVVPSVPRQEVSLAQDPASGIDWGQFHETTLFATSYIAFGNTVPPLDDVHVRRALQAVFPVAQYAAGQFGSTVTPATGLVPPGMLGVSWNAQVPMVSAETALAELRQSRYGSADQVPLIELYAADVDPIESLADVAASELGLRVRAIEVPFGDFVQGLGERRFPAYSVYWGADYPDPESLLGMLFGATSPDNYTGFTSPAFEDLLARSHTETGDERIATLQQANQMLVDEAALIAFYHPRDYTLAREGFAPLEVTPLGLRGLETIREAT